MKFYKHTFIFDVSCIDKGRPVDKDNYLVQAGIQLRYEGGRKVAEIYSRVYVDATCKFKFMYEKKHVSFRMYRKLLKKYRARQSAFYKDQIYGDDYE